jgi:hypothetical protein
MRGFKEEDSTSAGNGKLGNQFLLAEFAVDVILSLMVIDL